MDETSSSARNTFGGVRCGIMFADSCLGNHAVDEAGRIIDLGARLVEGGQNPLGLFGGDAQWRLNPQNQRIRPAGLREDLVAVEQRLQCVKYMEAFDEPFILRN